MDLLTYPRIQVMTCQKISALFANLSGKVDILEVSKYCTSRTFFLFHCEDCQ